MCLCSLEQLNHNLLELSNKDYTQRKLQQVMLNRNLDLDEDDLPEQMSRKIILYCFEYRVSTVGIL